MKKSIIALSVFILVLSMFTGCSSKTKFTIGITQIAPHGSLDNCREGFIAGLEEEGFAEGKQVTFDYKNANGDTANAALIADTFVSKDYDLILGIATPTAMAAYNAALETDIPVVFSAVSDPIAAEIVESLEVPGTNSTGTSDALPLEQQMKLIRAIMPEAKTIGILYTTSEVNSLTHLEIFKELAPTYGFTIEAIGVNTSSDIPLAVDTLLTKVDCINNFTDNNVVNNLDTVLAKSNEAGIPVFGSEEEQVKKGCVAAENIDYFELGKETGRIAAKILNGEDASKIPVSVISSSLPVANQKAMDLFGLSMPEEYADTVTYLSAE
jgi:putative tryptophan/tyrosine transport system substrate-binding protein